MHRSCSSAPPSRGLTMLRRFAPALLLLLIGTPGLLHSQYFGRNKVQYTNFDFKVIQTEHFDVYYYDREREAAMDGARMAERAYAKDRKSTRLNSSHANISYAVFCLKKKIKTTS